LRASETYLSTTATTKPLAWSNWRTAIRTPLLHTPLLYLQ
jgi:hypothetical protein